MDFTVSREIVEFVRKVESFIDAHVVPAERGLSEHDFGSGRVENDILPPLRDRAKARACSGHSSPTSTGARVSVSPPWRW